MYNIFICMIIQWYVGSGNERATHAYLIIMLITRIIQIII